uniref:Putative Protease inhibitor n=1 Tax=Megacormus gertschi TaxID=1843536 RepID=A0A224XBR3_9SCOR
MQKTILALAGVITVALSSCVPTNNTIDTTDVQSSLPSLQYGSINFALEMFRVLHAGSTTSDNLFFSPVSVWTALVTIYEGSRHQTAKELAEVLGITNTSPAILPSALAAFLRSCKGCREGDQSDLKMANRIYFQEDLEFKLCNQQLQEIIHKIDFKSDPEKARTIINDYVEGETNGKIQELIPPNSVSPLTQMIIANAVYFKGIWRNKFHPSMTRQVRFQQDRESVLSVPMMNTMGTYYYSVSDQMDCQALEIPYTSDGINMLILLPKHSFRGLDTLARTISPERLEALLNSMASREVLVSIPKFKVEQQYELAKPLQKMGLRNLFDPRFSDLSGFTGSRLNLDAIHHKSYIKVNEEGTEAAAATAFVISRTGTHDTGITRFYADRPFLYFIRDSRSNNLLFVGTVKSPHYSEESQRTQGDF